MSQTREIHQDELEELAWVDVASSQVRRVAWLNGQASADLGLVAVPDDGNEETRLNIPLLPHLLVDFRGSGTYAYEGADHDAFVDLASADSVGRTLNASVKGKYEFVKLTVIAG